ncbi:MAG: EthD domain-containing protein, partial [Pseudomonadales bacterium]
GVQRYVQCHVIPESYDDGEPAYDGITELYWSSYAAAVRSMASDEMIVEQASDASNFVASDSVEVVLMHEDVP